MLKTNLKAELRAQLEIMLNELDKRIDMGSSNIYDLTLVATSGEGGMDENDKPYEETRASIQVELISCSDDTWAIEHMLYKYIKYQDSWDHKNNQPISTTLEEFTEDISVCTEEKGQETMQRYLVTHQDDTGIGGFETISGINVFEAVKQALRNDVFPVHDLSYFCVVDNHDAEEEECCEACIENCAKVADCLHSEFIGLDSAVKHVLSNIHNSFVNGDSDSQVTIFNITDPTNVVLEDLSQYNIEEEVK